MITSIVIKVSSGNDTLIFDKALGNILAYYNEFYSTLFILNNFVDSDETRELIDACTTGTDYDKIVMNLTCTIDGAYVKVVSDMMDSTKRSYYQLFGRWLINMKSRYCV